MCKGKVTFILLVSSICLINLSFAGEAEKVPCTGKVVNSEGNPVESAKVGFYKVTVSTEVMSYKVALDKEVETDREGKFEYELDKAGSQNMQVIIIYAQKEGFGFGWANWEMRSSQNVEIRLFPAAPVSGVVVDELDKPVADANVSLAFMMIKTGDQPQIIISEVMPDKLTTKTDEQGKFSFDDIPENAKFDFRVKKPGRATTVTMDMQKFEINQTLGYSAGQTDIKIVQSPEAIIKGIVVQKETGKPVGGVRISLGQDSQISILYSLKPVISAEDGTFSINELPVMKFSLAPVNPVDKASEWVSKSVEVTTQAGKTTSGVKIELEKGELLEVLVKDANDMQPLEQVSVILQPQQGGKTESARTNKDGIAQFRLATGSYRIVQIYKQDYKRTQPDEVFAIEDGKTKHMEFSLESYGKITGTVRDENNNPVSGAIVFVNPPIAGETRTDINGKFSLTERQGGFEEEGAPYLIVRDKEHNLAASYELYDKRENIEIKLLKGITISGKVVDSNDNAIREPKISVVFRTSNVGVIKEEKNVADKQGNFKIQALPEGVTYSIYAQADDYGRESTGNKEGLKSGDSFELDPIVLKLANMSVSGIVLDVDGKPASDADVYCSGTGQTQQHVKTDNEGKFTLEKVCSGRISVQAQKQNESGKTLFGYTQTEGGATDVQIIVSESGSARTVQPRLVPLKGKSLPDTKSMIPDFNADSIQGKRVLVCFWDYEQRPSRNCVLQLNKQVKELEDKGVTVLTIQASKIDSDTLNQWIKDNNLSLPVGRIETDIEKTRINWGVKALPWLILTDKNHIVTVEGFSINELQGKIQSVDEK